MSVIIKSGSSSNLATVLADGSLQVEGPAGSGMPVSGSDVIDSGNSSTTPLGISAVFTGTFHSALGYAAVQVALDTDQISANTATTGLAIQWSEDGVNVSDNEVVPVVAGDLFAVNGQDWSFPVKRQYYRIVYTNGGTGQGIFRLQTTLRVTPASGCLMDMNDSITSNLHAQLVRAVPSPTFNSGAALTPVYVASTASAVLKATAGNLYGVWMINLADTTSTTVVEVMYLHFFNTTTTAGLSTSSWLFALAIPAATQGTVGGTGTGNPLALTPGAFALANFSSGIVIVVNTTSTSNTTASGTAPSGVVWIQ